LHYEFKADLNKYLKSLSNGARVHSMEDVIKFNEENSDKVMPFFGQEHMTTAQEKLSLSDKKYKDALAKNHSFARTKGIDAALRKHKLDAIVVPSGGPAWMIDLVNGIRSTPIWKVRHRRGGYPHITVPADVFGLPVGLVRKAWQEPTLIKFAYAFEQATQLRRMPRFASANLIHSFHPRISAIF
jgi:amidase